MARVHHHHDFHARLERGQVRGHHFRRVVRVVGADVVFHAIRIQTIVQVDFPAVGREVIVVVAAVGGVVVEEVVAADRLGRGIRNRLAEIGPRCIVVLDELHVRRRPLAARRDEVRHVLGVGDAPFEAVGAVGRLVVVDADADGVVGGRASVADGKKSSQGEGHAGDGFGDGFHIRCSVVVLLGGGPRRDGGSPTF